MSYTQGMISKPIYDMLPAHVQKEIDEHILGYAMQYVGTQADIDWMQEKHEAEVAEKPSMGNLMRFVRINAGCAQIVFADKGSWEVFMPTEKQASEMADEDFEVMPIFYLKCSKAFSRKLKKIVEKYGIVAEETNADDLDPDDYQIAVIERQSTVH